MGGSAAGSPVPRCSVTGTAPAADSDCAGAKLKKEERWGERRERREKE